MRPTASLLSSPLLLMSLALAPAARAQLAAPVMPPCETRIPISSLPYPITQPGSYFVTEDLVGVAGSDGVTIFVPGVSLDLNGFSLAGVPGSGHGVVVTGASGGVEVHGGTLHDWGARGVDAEFTSSGSFHDLRVYHCGDDGMHAGSTPIVRDCWLVDNGGYGLRTYFGASVRGVSCQSNDAGGILGGFHPTIEDCTVFDNGGDGIAASGGATIRGCAVSSHSGGTGIRVFDGAAIADCSSIANQFGIQAGRRSTISACTASSNTASGIRAQESTIADCTASDNQAHGMDVEGATSITGCTLTGNGLRGIEAGAGCTIARCTVSANGDLGIYANANSSIADCTVSANGAAGIQTTTASRVERCNVEQNAGGIEVASSCQVLANQVSGGAILATGSNNKIDSNNVLGGKGVSYVVQGTGNLIVRNSGHTTSLFLPTYDVAANNSLGPVSDVAGATHPWSNIEF